MNTPERDAPSVDGAQFKKKASKCTISVDGLFDKLGGYFEAGSSASRTVYILRRINDLWVVVKDVLMWLILPRQSSAKRFFPEGIHPEQTR
jgi:hypothetical protein